MQCVTDKKQTLTLPTSCPQRSAVPVVLMSVPVLAHAVLYQTPGHPFHQKLSKPTHSTLSLCNLAQVLKYQAVSVEAFSMCPNPRATSCMKSPSLRKHPSHSRHSLILYRKLCKWMHAGAHTCCPQCLYNFNKVFKTRHQQCVFMLMYLPFSYLCGIDSSLLWPWRGKASGIEEWMNVLWHVSIMRTIFTYKIISYLKWSACLQ